LVKRIRNRFAEVLAGRHPELHATVEAKVWTMQWRINCKHVGKGKTALRYASAYVAKSAFTEKRLAGYNAQGRILLRCKNSDTGIWKTIALKPVEFIRRWLIHVLPKGFVRVRHYGLAQPGSPQSPAPGAPSPRPGGAASAGKTGPAPDPLPALRWTPRVHREDPTATRTSSSPGDPPGRLEKQ
jgi:hypothetical protein